MKSKFILPRDVVRIYDVIKEEAIERLQSKVKQIRSEDMDELRNNIYDVVYVSSNGDEVITEYIADLYKDLGAPAISCILAPDGITKKRMINGYQYPLVINDRLYINSEDNTVELNNADIVIFGTKITSKTYQKILKPLNLECAKRGRNLIVAAPAYDEIALQQVISVDLNNEYRNKKSVNMILTTYRAISAHTRKLVNDFSVLMNTTVIDRALESSILDQLATGNTISQIFNIDERGLEGTKCIAFGEENIVTYSYGIDELPETYTPVSEAFPLVENYINLGFVKQCSLGLKTSQFTDLVYDKNRYDVILADAKNDLEEKEQKYQKLGTFNIEVSQAQERLYALNLKMGIIEVGADSELSQKLLKDAVDDAVKAASSAYKHGVVLGCNTNLIQVLTDMYNDDTDRAEVDRLLIKILLDGFKDVYKTVLNNAFEDDECACLDIKAAVIKLKEFIDTHMRVSEDVFTDEEILYKAVENVVKRRGDVSIHDTLVEYSILSNKVLDITNFTYSDRVVNSCQTDEEILKATIDLIGILIVGNQMVITQKHNF